MHIHEVYIHTKVVMMLSSVSWNPNDTPDRSSLLSLRLRNTSPLIRASNSDE